MRRDRRLRQAEVRREFADPVRPVGKAVDERQPGRLGQCPEDTGYILVLVQIIIHRHAPFISLSDDDNKAGCHITLPVWFRIGRLLAAAVDF